jgi:hypothetical protein
MNLVRVAVKTGLLLVLTAASMLVSAEWESVTPGDGTICSDGSDYRFFYRRGSAEKLLIYFQGGGACWFPENCDVHLSPSYKVNVAEDDPSRYRGILEFDNPDNPFADYSVVMAPYCTADAHMGDRLTTYDAPAAEDHEAHPVTIHHRGFRNADAVLAWTYAEIPEPTDVFVTGSSAGSIPSPYYAWQVADYYVDAGVSQLGDASGGYRRSTATNSARVFQWGTLEFLAARHDVFRGVAGEAFNYELLYIKAAAARPDIQFAQYDAAEDRVQKRFLAMGGNEANTLRELLLLNQQDIAREASNFRVYIAPGESHTILSRPEFYTTAVNGVRFRDWVADLAARRTVDNVRCDPCIESPAGSE